MLDEAAAALWASRSFTDRTFMAAREMGLAWFWLGSCLGVRVLFGCGFEDLAGSGGEVWIWRREMIWTFERNVKEGIELQKFTGEPFVVLLV